jgi:uncharacterized protein YnzC (UPF0291/DUF896 family)
LSKQKKVLDGIKDSLQMLERCNELTEKVSNNEATPEEIEEQAVSWMTNVDSPRLNLVNQFFFF